MSMYRQLLLAILISTIVALGGGLIASVFNARSYLQDQLSMKNTDNATALALSISASKPDPVMAELAVAALFDSGHYELIRITNPSGAIIVERVSAASDEDHYPLLEKLIPLDAPAGIAEINDGWKVFGTVTLQSHSRFAYRALWQTILQLSFATLLAGSLGSFLGFWVLQRLKAPLDQVVDQATAISNKRFITIPEPSVPELKQLASAMNAMVSRLKALFEADAEKLATLRAENDHDTLTGLVNRQFFMTSLPVSLTDGETPSGWLMLIRIAGLEAINRQLGRESCDQLLSRVGETLQQQAQQHPRSLAARLNGADFALLLPGEQDGSHLAKHIQQLVRQVVETFAQTELPVLFGAAYYQGNLQPGELLAAADRALLQSEDQQGTPVCISPSCNDQLPKTMQAWSELLLDTVQQKRVRLARFAVTDCNSQHTLHFESPLRLQFEANGEWQPAGSFLAIANRLQLTSRLDLQAVRLGLISLQSEPDISGIAVNLAANSIADSEFQRDLLDLLKHYAAYSERLWLEVPACGALNHIQAFRSLCSALKSHPVKIGLEHFGRELDRFSNFYDLGLDYLKVDSLLVRNLDQNPSNKLFLQGMVGMMQQIGIRVIAEGVVSDHEKALLQELGFDGMTGPGVTLNH